MSERLKLAFAEASKLPEDEQERFAEFLLCELIDEREWQRKFESSQDLLSKLAAEARSERAAGSTRPLEDLIP